MIVMKELAAISVALAKSQKKWISVQETIAVMTEQIQQAHDLEEALKEIIRHEIDLTKSDINQTFEYNESALAMYRYAISAAGLDPRSGNLLMSTMEEGHNPPIELVHSLMSILADKIDQKFKYIETLIEMIPTD